jgi:hypothetical protein
MGTLTKTVNATEVYGKVGRRCVEYEQVEPPPPPPSEPDDPPPPPPDNDPPPPDEVDDPCDDCPQMKLEYYWDGATCYAVKKPVDSTIGGWPACCGGMPFKVADSKCGQ